uniref:hypothetical protein n=1 Tax=Acetatifactor sp. TaxID=1872090 RepID=UPI0040575209
MKYINAGEVESGLLEEWVHTYLLYERKNKPFSDGLYLEERYFIGPVSMPLMFCAASIIMYEVVRQRGKKR